MAKRPDDIIRSNESGFETRSSSLDLSSPDNLAKMDADTDGKTEEIRAKIEETRTDMGETIDAIQERLSFANISEQVSEQVTNAIETAKDSVYDATIGKVVDLMKNTGNDISQSQMVRTVRENPLPFILIGAGAGLLAYQGFSKKARHTERRDQGRYLTGNTEHEGSINASTPLESVRVARETISNAAGNAYRSVSRAAEETYAEAGELAGRAYEKAGDLGTKAQQTYTHLLEEKPWAIGVAALAAGAAVGMAIPATRYENELLGEARVNVMNKVQEAADGLVDRAKQAATEAGRNISDGAKSLAEETIG